MECRGAGGGEGAVSERRSRLAALAWSIPPVCRDKHEPTPQPRTVKTVVYSVQNYNPHHYLIIPKFLPGFD